MEAENKFVHTYSISSGVCYVVKDLLRSSSVPAWGGRCSWWSWERGWSRSLSPQPAERPGGLSQMPEVPAVQQGGVNPQNLWCPLCSCTPSSHLQTRKKSNFNEEGSIKRYLTIYKHKIVPARSNLRIQSLSLNQPGSCQTSWCEVCLLALSGSPPSSWCSSSSPAVTWLTVSLARQSLTETASAHQRLGFKTTPSEPNFHNNDTAYITIP